MVIILTENISSKYYPANKANPSIAEYEYMIATAPFFALILFVVGHALSSFFGSYVAARIAPKEYKLLSGFTIGFFLLLGGIVLFISIRFPLWMGISTCCLYLLSSLLAIKIAK